MPYNEFYSKDVRGLRLLLPVPLKTDFVYKSLDFINILLYFEYNILLYFESYLYYSYLQICVELMRRTYGSTPTLYSDIDKSEACICSTLPGIVSSGINEKHETTDELVGIKTNLKLSYVFNGIVLLCPEGDTAF